MVVLRGHRMRSCSPSHVCTVWFRSTLRRYPAGDTAMSWRGPEMMARDGHQEMVGH